MMKLNITTKLLQVKLSLNLNAAILLIGLVNSPINYGLI